MKEPTISSEPITELISNFIPNITPDNQIGDEVFYKLPGEMRDVFQRLLLALEQNQEKLGIFSIQVTGSELNEVYMTLGLEATMKPSIPEVCK